MLTARSTRWWLTGVLLSTPGAMVFATGTYHLVVRVGAFWTMNVVAFLCVLRAAYLDGTTEET